MTDGGLAQYLRNKGAAMSAAAAALPGGDAARETISAECTASDLTGVRRVRIRDFQLVSDSGPAFGGHGLGPSSPELLLGTLSSCLTHTYLIGAASKGIALDEVRVRVEARNNDARLLGLATADPDVPFDVRAFVTLKSDASQEHLAALHSYVESMCPLTRIIREPQPFAIEHANG